MTVDFEFSSEQAELRGVVRDFLKVHKGATWQRLTGELGLTALAIGAEYGGAGASLVEVGIVLEEAGAALLPDPLLSTVVAAAALDPALPGAAELLPALAAGTTVATLAIRATSGGTATRDGRSYRLDGVWDNVLDGQVADVFVVAADDCLFAVRDAAVTRHTTVDTTRGQARLVLRGTPGVLVGASTVDHALDLLRAALAVESVGVARASLQSTVDHLKTREQFGVPLATFQALRHRVADLAVALEQATSSAWYALRVADTCEFAVAAPVAKLLACDAAFDITAAAIQLAGGIGFTWEHPAHHYLKRATTNRLLAGDPIALRRLIGRRAGIRP